MKHGIFISYSDYDKDKVELIVNELLGHKMFFPIVIASDRKALKLLTQKVAEGIVKAEIILPIFTKNSIATQWINQEIGYAAALEKKIMPMVESNLIDNLKGFIHKQIDLPYNYSTNSTSPNDNSDFLIQVKNIIKDLETIYESPPVPEIFPEKSQYEKMLEETDRVSEEIEFKKQRKEFLNSNIGMEASIEEVLGMFEDIELKIGKLRDRKFQFGFDKVTHQPEFILRCDGFSFSIAWSLKYTDTIAGPFIYIKYWKGNLTNDPNAFYRPNARPEMLSDTIFLFDRTKENEYTWLSNRNQKSYSSQEIVDMCLTWLVGAVGKKKLEEQT